MFAAMMDAIKEESVGFLFNLEVQVADEDAEPAEAPAGPTDAERLVADIAAGKSAVVEEHPHISAKGLDRTNGAAPLTYSAPSLGSEAPEVRTDGNAKPTGGSRPNAARRQRTNPNRGSRGNRRKR
jgi:preprotein translocase subunit SecA